MAHIWRPQPQSRLSLGLISSGACLLILGNLFFFKLYLINVVMLVAVLLSIVVHKERFQKQSILYIASDWLQCAALTFFLGGSGMLLGGWIDRLFPINHAYLPHFYFTAMVNSSHIFTWMSLGMLLACIIVHDVQLKDELRTYSFFGKIAIHLTGIIVMYIGMILGCKVAMLFSFPSSVNFYITVIGMSLFSSFCSIFIHAYKALIKSFVS